MTHAEIEMTAFLWAIVGLVVIYYFLPVILQFLFGIAFMVVVCTPPVILYYLGAPIWILIAIPVILVLAPFVYAIIRPNSDCAVEVARILEAFLD